jgi:hypothetical protein
LSRLQLAVSAEDVGEAVVEAVIEVRVEVVEEDVFPVTLQFRRSNATVPRIDTK